MTERVSERSLYPQALKCPLSFELSQLKLLFIPLSLASLRLSLWGPQAERVKGAGGLCAGEGLALILHHIAHHSAEAL